MKFSNLINILSKKLPKEKVVWCVGIPYTKETFIECCDSHGSSDFIESLEFQYAATDREILWEYYAPTANKLHKTVRYLEKKGVDIINIFSPEDLKKAFAYPTVILTAHRHRFLECMDFMGHTLEIGEIIKLIPKDYKGIVDISSCYSATLLIQCKQTAPFATFIAAETEVSVKLRLFIYEHTIRLMISHPRMDYLDAFRVIISRIIKSAKTQDSFKGDVFLGGKQFSNSKIERNVSVFAPNEVRSGETMLIQIYIYKNNVDVTSSAKMADEDLVEKDRLPVNLDLIHKDDIKIILNVFNSPLLSQTKPLLWNDRISRISFFIDIPNDYDKNKLYFSALVVQNNAVVGELNFCVKIVTEYSQNRIPTNIIFKEFNKVFISYSHEDESKVKFIAQAYKAIDKNYFFDRHCLKPGSVYPIEIEDYINSSDLFILCWSENAAKSDYVEKELKQALSLAFPQIKPKEKAQLTIHPLLLDSNAELPENMKHIYNFESI